MGRGKHLSTKAKEMRGLMSAMMAGIAKGEIEATKLRTKAKNLPYMIIQKFEELSMDGIFKFVSIIGMAVIIKTGIQWSEQILAQSQNIVKWLYFFSGHWFAAVSFHLMPDQKQKLKEIMDSPTAEVIEWIVAFTLAYLLVEHFGELVKATGSIVGAASSLMGLAMAG